MKQDKAMLQMGHSSLLESQFNRLKAMLGKDRVIVSGDRSQYPHVKDIESGLGPLEGLRSVLYYLLKNNHQLPILVVPVDMPFMDELGLEKLMSLSSTRAIAKFKGYQLPFVIYNLPLALQTIEEIKAAKQIENRNSFNSFFERLEIFEVEPESKKFFVNLNTPEEWNAAIL